MFVDRPEFVSVLAQFDIEGNILPMFKKILPVSLDEICLQTDGKTDTM